MLLLWAAGTAGCDGRSVRERQAEIDPLHLWRVEAVEAGQAGEPVEICADAMVRQGFVLPLPTAGGQACVLEDEPVQHAGYVAARCRIGGQRFGVTSAVSSLSDTDFTVDASIRPIGPGSEGYRQLRRYTRLGACPDGWRIGETRGRDGVRRTDALTRR